VVIGVTEDPPGIGLSPPGIEPPIGVIPIP
jgi:hypothetical protein